MGGGTSKSSNKQAYVEPTKTEKEKSAERSTGSKVVNVGESPYQDTASWTKFGEKYKLDADVLGQGGFAVVQLGTLKDTGKKVAVKMVNRCGEESVTAELALHKENNVLKDLNHPHVVRALDFFENDKQLRFVIEYLDGGELFNRIVEKSYYNEKEARDLVYVLLSGIKYLHDKNVVHRDLKPENLLMTSPDDEADLKLVDFGFAAVLGEGEQLTDAFGTVGYCSPEVIRAQPHGKPVDMWAFGVLLFLLLSGVHPFDNGESEKVVNTRSANNEWKFHPEYWAAVSDEAKDLVKKLLVKDPVERFTCDQALSHPWMHLDGVHRDLLGAKDNLKKFLALKKLRAGVNAVKASLKMSKSVRSIKGGGMSFSANSRDNMDNSTGSGGVAPDIMAAQQAAQAAAEVTAAEAAADANEAVENSKKE